MKPVLLVFAAALGLRFACMTASAAPTATDRANVAGFTFIRSLGGIDEYRLDANGLQVLVKPDHSAPVATFQVTYHVGSRNEVTGTTGSTHLLEHLMFKGSTHFNDPAGKKVLLHYRRSNLLSGNDSGPDRLCEICSRATKLRECSIPDLL
jgi:zinc protease